MKRFKHAIVRRPCKNMIHGLSTAGLGIPDFEKAHKQHDVYIEALQSCGLEVTTLDADERFPDSVFIEDIALLTPDCAIVTLPGAPSRMAENEGIENVLQQFYQQIEFIVPPGTVEAGDIMMVGRHFYIGISERTTQAGASQLVAILEKFGMSGSTIGLGNILHLKTGVSYLENNTMLLIQEMADKTEFKSFNKIIVARNEAYAANSIWINNKVLMPDGFPETIQKVRDKGYEVITMDVSEFQKLDGGLSCLSLRF